jgi:Tat protein translocase TatB subunit
MLRAMFGMGGTEILVILIVALLFLGPDKLPEAAKKISKGIRDIKKQSRVLQRTIEDDEHIGGAIRDLRSALRGEEEPYRPPPIKPTKVIEASATSDAVAAVAAASLPAGEGPESSSGPDASDHAFEGAHMAAHPEPMPNGEPSSAAAADAPRLTLPPTAGEPNGPPGDDSELAALVKPAPNTIARGAAPTESSEPPETKHG